MLKKSLTPYGELIRRLRMKHGVYQKTMSYLLGYEMNYLNMIETGNERIPDDLEERITKVMPELLGDNEAEELHKAIELTKAQEKAEEEDLKMSFDSVAGIKCPDVVYELEDGAYPPLRAHADDAGMDLYASHNALIMTSAPVVIKTGVHLLIPRGYVGLICPRSGLTQQGLVAEIGVVDAGFTGEIQVTMRLNDCVIDNDDYVHAENRLIERGSRIAQMLILPIAYPTLTKGEVINVKTERGQNGYGSTGK